MRVEVVLTNRKSLTTIEVHVFNSANRLVEVLECSATPTSCRSIARSLKHSVGCEITICGKALKDTRSIANNILKAHIALCEELLSEIKDALD